MKTPAPFIAAGLAALLCAPVAVADVYQCEVDGVTTFSDRPCAQGAAEVDTRPVGSVGSTTGTAADNPGLQYIYELAEQRRQRKIMQEHIRKERVAIGMTPDQVRRSWGDPDKINRSVYESGVHEQWVYKVDDIESQYVYFRDGVVTGIN